ncbi:MAG TPA: glycosyltransferase family 9 protein [Candidatus Limnocylindria bacterium]
MSGWREARNVLAVRLDNAGDVVMLGPALRAVKETSGARITLLASPAGTEAARLLPWVDDVITLPAVWQDVGARIPFNPARELALIDELRRRAFDAALIFTSFSQTPHAPAYACYLAAIPLRAGDTKEFGGSVLTTELRSTDADDGIHQAERDLRLVEAVGFAVRDRSLAIHVDDHARAAARAALEALGVSSRYVLAHPGASASARRYPTDRFRDVVGLIAASGMDVVVTGTERERSLVERATPAVTHAHALIGGLALPEYAAVVERASAVVCGNTLPLHLADALRVPVVALYAGTDLETQWRARDTDAVVLRRDTPCHPCYLFDCPIGQPCLDIAPDLIAKEVLDAADRRVACAAAG